MDISTFVVNPVTLALLVMFLVQFIKDLGLKGNTLRFVSLAVGAALAFTYKARELWPAYASSIDVGFFVLAVGLGACGLYSLIDERIPRVAPSPLPSPQRGEGELPGINHAPGVTTPRRGEGGLPGINHAPGVTTPRRGEGGLPGINHAINTSALQGGEGGLPSIHKTSNTSAPQGGEGEQR